MKRAAYKVAVAEAIAEGFSPVYVDENGFASETLRQHGYAVRGSAFQMSVQANTIGGLL